MYLQDQCQWCQWSRVWQLEACSMSSADDNDDYNVYFDDNDEICWFWWLFWHFRVWQLEACSMSSSLRSWKRRGRRMWMDCFRWYKFRHSVQCYDVLVMLWWWWWCRWFRCLQATYSWCYSGLQRFALRGQKLFKWPCFRYLLYKCFFPIKFVSSNIYSFCYHVLFIPDICHQHHQRTMCFHITFR